jgi:thioredoxin-related protein
MSRKTKKHAPRVVMPGACICLVMLCFLISAASAKAQQYTGIHWLTYTEALSSGKKAGKPMFIFFRAPWCYFCTKMQRQVFPDPQLSAFINNRFLAVDVDVSKESQAAEAYKVSYLPTSIFLSSQGKPVLILKGYLSSQRLLKALSFVADGQYAKMSFQAYEDKN